MLVALGVRVVVGESDIQPLGSRLEFEAVFKPEVFFVDAIDGKLRDFDLFT